VPFVTIQLPLYNEKYVAVRLIETSARINYPKDRYEIQVLDDSTDETLALTSELVTKYRREGYRIHHIHRDNRVGHKGGALRNGLARAAGEFIAIFDADFLPDRDILNNVLPYFLQDESVGMVQTRWGHVNPDFSGVTKAQAIFIDSHFQIDQSARAGSGLFMNFNGTAGVWRKDCILDSGNWQDDTLTEDLDLSYRAILKGWNLKYINDIVNKAELPVQLDAFMTQQFRWAKGAVQSAIKHMKQVFRSKHSVFVKLQAFFHLTYYFVHPLLLVNLLLAFPLIAGIVSFDRFQGVFAPLALILAVAMIIPSLLFMVSQIKSHKDWLKRFTWIPFALTIGTGIMVNNSWAVLEAILGKKTEFIRTPKWGVKNKGESWTGKTYKVFMGKWRTRLLELLLGLYAVLGVIVSIVRNNYFIVPYLTLMGVGLLLVFLVSSVQNYKLRRVGTGRLLDPHWDQGKAEFQVYEGTAGFYGIEREITSSMILVKEPFDRHKLVKDSSSTYSVLKMIRILKIPTGMYDHLYMANKIHS
jgi:cellulose synthase/poly-beta-1,6-N-acetylglucosamine synthase-like glycosyltransferase